MKYKVEIDGEIFEVTIQDVHAKPVLAEVNGETYQVWPQAEATGHAPVPATAHRNFPYGLSSGAGRTYRHRDICLSD